MFLKMFHNLFFPEQSISGLLGDFDDIYIGIGDHEGNFIVDKYLVSKIVPDLKVGSVTLTASPLSVNYYFVWQHEEYMIYHNGIRWVYMPNCPYPGYEPTDEDEYYLGDLSENLYEMHGQNIVFEGMGAADGKSKNITVDFGNMPVVVNLIEGDDTEVYIAEVATWQ